MTDLGAGDVIIQTVAFSADTVEITWTDPTSQNPRVQEHRIHVIDRAVADVEISEALDSLRAALDRALVFKRNPPERITARRRSGED